MLEYFEYKGVKYGEGTKARVNVPFYGPRIATYRRWAHYEWFEYDNQQFYPHWNTKPERYIIEIIYPVYYTDKSTPITTSDRIQPPAWDVEIGWVWYILIIAVGSIFKDRIGIWAMATAYFFLWKNGFFNRKGKK